MERKVELTDVFADGLIVRIPYDELDIKVVAEPVKHGHWLAVKGWDEDLGELDSAECSVCHETQESEYWAKTHYKYCPNCGAKMDEAEENETD